MRGHNVYQSSRCRCSVCGIMLLEDADESYARLGRSHNSNMRCLMCGPCMNTDDARSYDYWRRPMKVDEIATLWKHMLAPCLRGELVIYPEALEAIFDGLRNTIKRAKPYPRSQRRVMAAAACIIYWAKRIPDVTIKIKRVRHRPKKDYSRFRAKV